MTREVYVVCIFSRREKNPSGNSVNSTTVGGGHSSCRHVLLLKILDVVYLVGLRIGEEMARVHLTPVCTAFFAAFDKVPSNEIQNKYHQPPV